MLTKSRSNHLIYILGRSKMCDFFDEIFEWKFIHPSYPPLATGYRLHIVTLTPPTLPQLLAHQEAPAWSLGKGSADAGRVARGG